MPVLRRAIGFTVLLLLAINALLGTGIFFHPGIAAGFAGPASLIAWVAVALFAMLIAGFFAELVSTWPRAGGIYEYAKHGLAESGAFLVGWLAWLTASITIATELVGGLLYLLPAAPVFTHIALALGLLGLFSVIAMRGIRLSAAVLLGFGIATIAVIAIFITAGLPAINIANYFPFFIAGAPFIALAAFFIAEMFFGWEGVTYLAEEVKEPKKAVPRALIAATGVLALLGFSVAAISMGILRWDVLAASAAPLTAAAEAVSLNLGMVIALIAAIAIIGTAASWIVFAPRLLFAMARDNLVIHGIQRLHPRYATPHLAIALQAAVVAFVMLLSFGQIQILFGFLIPLYVLLYLAFLVCYARLRLLPIRREFSAPLGKVGPPIAGAFLLGLLAVWLTTAGTLWIFAVTLLLVVLGFPAYIAVKLQTDRAFVEKFWNRAAVVLNIYIPLLLTGQRQYFTAMADLKRQHTVLDYGCGAGHLTEQIAKRVDRVVAADISERQLIKALARLSRADIPNTIFVKVSRPAPFPAGSFDRIVCTIAINYFVQPKKELAALSRTLKDGGRALFLAIRAPAITALPFLRHDRTIKSVFRAAGFKRAAIRRISAFGCEYIYINAVK